MAQRTSTRGRPIRYAVVGLGHIAQVAVLPAFAHARRNSRLTAVVSDDSTKRREIARRYKLDGAYSYDQFEECLEGVDAVYIALPNSMHAEYTIRAARAGVHVLCEKPMAVTVEECERMIAACEDNGVKLMIAYRLHFEEINLRAIDLVRKGRIGEPKFFNSSFAMSVRAGDIRTKREHGGGSLYDIGVYCINAARYLFRAEPKEVMALSVNSGVARLSEVDEIDGGAAALRRRTGRVLCHQLQRGRRRGVPHRRDERPAARQPGVRVRRGPGVRAHHRREDAEEAHRQARPVRPELLHFSDCILRNREPEPSGAEGLQDVRIVQALYQSADTGKAVQIPPHVEGKRPTGAQRITRPGIAKPKLVKVQSASR